MTLLPQLEPIDVEFEEVCDNLKKITDEYLSKIDVRGLFVDVVV